MWVQVGSKMVKKVVFITSDLPTYPVFTKNKVLGSHSLESNDSWYCILCCDEIFPFGTLANKNFLSLLNSHPDVDDCFTNNMIHISVKTVPYH